jgi:hypothetical protein
MTGRASPRAADGGARPSSPTISAVTVDFHAGTRRATMPRLGHFIGRYGRVFGMNLRPL